MECKCKMELKNKLKKWIDCIHCEDCLETIETDIESAVKLHNSDVSIRNKGLLRH